MRGAVRNKERWKGPRAPTQDPSTNHLLSRTQVSIRDTIQHTDNGTSTGPHVSAEVASHDVVVLVLSPVSEVNHAQ